MVLWAVLGAGALLFAAVAWTMLFYRNEVVATEGSVALGVQSVIDGVPIYSGERFATEPFVVIHDTPLYYLIVAPLASLTQEPFLAGRLVSILFTLGTAIAVGTIAAHRAKARGPGVAAALLWLSFYQVVFWGTALGVDATAIFFEVVGLALALRVRERDRVPWESLPLFVLAWAAKPLMVAGLVAVVLDLLARRRRDGLRYTAASAAGLGAAFAVLAMGTDGAFVRAVMKGTTWVAFSLELFRSPWHILLLLLAAGSVWLRRDRIMGLYLVIAVVLAVAAGGVLPRLVPALAAMAILVPSLLDELATRPRLRTATIAALVLVGAVHLAYEMLPLVAERITGLRFDGPRLAVASALASITTPESTVLAQDVGMVLSARRKPGVADPLVLSALASRDAWDPAVLAPNIHERRYDAIVLDQPLESIDGRDKRTLWIAPLRDEIARAYELADVYTFDATWRFLEPTRYVYLPKRD